MIEGAINAKVDELTAPISEINKSIFGIAAANPTIIFKMIKNIIIRKISFVN